MINAREARELAELSSNNIDKRVEAICTEIRKAAELGERFVIPQDKMYHDHDKWLRIEVQPYRHAEFTPMQRLVSKKLDHLGFTVRILVRDIKVGGGLGSMDEPSREEPQHYIEVRW